MWTGLAWQKTTPELPKKSSAEQWDQAVALAAGPGGYVAVGSNSDVTGYVGRLWHSADSLAWSLEDHDFLDGLELVDIAATAQTYVAIGTRSADPNDPVAVILDSSDGVTWTQGSPIRGAWASRVAAGPTGFAVVMQVGDGTNILVSSDGRAWAPTAPDGIAPNVSIADIAWDRGGWLAVGSAGDHAVAYRSTDATSWTEDPLPASGPTKGILDVSAYRVVPGRWATLILGLDREQSCAEDDDWCGKYQASWSWTEQSGWARLPNSTWINGRGFGVDIFPADDAGFLYILGDDVRISADGWDWRHVRQQPSADAFPSDAVVVGQTVVGVGIPAGAGDELAGWFGSAIVGQ